MRLLLFTIIAFLISAISVSKRPVLLVGFIVFIYFIYPQKYIWGIEEYHVVKILTLFSALIIVGKYGFPSVTDGVSVLMVLLGLSFFVSAIFAPVNTIRAIDYSLLFFKVIIFWLLIKTALKSIADVEIFIWSCILSVTVLASWGIQQYLLGNVRLEDFGGSQIVGSNQLASAFIWVLPIVYYRIISERGVLRIFAIASFAIIIAGVVCTESRQAFLALVVIGAYITYKSKYRVRVILAGCVLVSVLLSIAPETYFTRIESIGEYQEDGSAQGRIQQWVGAFEMAKDYPVLGVGGDNFTFVIESYSGESRESHNTFIQILSEEGLVGLIIFLLLMFFTIKRLSTVSTKNQELINRFQSDVYYTALGVKLGLIGLLVCCFFQNKAEHEFLYWTSAILVALENIYNEQTEL
jgi:probable O-glycosylation ligase (exosortase A-associated)